MIASALLALLLAPPPRAAQPAELTVLAASSLADVLPRLADAWTRGGGARVTFRFDASSRLAKQAEEGAPGDVFISADTDWVAYLEERKAAADSRRLLAGNHLVVVTASGAAAKLSSATDLSGAVRHLALASESVPAGRYAKAALEHLAVWDALKARVVRGDSVRGALKWVALGEADAGVVYATDAALEPRVRVAFTFPADSHPPIIYPGVVLRRSARPDEARAFLEFCAGPAGRPLWEAAGFPPPGS